MTPGSNRPAERAKKERKTEKQKNKRERETRRWLVSLKPRTGMLIRRRRLHRLHLSASEWGNDFCHEQRTWCRRWRSTVCAEGAIATSAHTRKPPHTHTHTGEVDELSLSSSSSPPLFYLWTTCGFFFLVFFSSSPSLFISFSLFPLSGPIVCYPFKRSLSPNLGWGVKVRIDWNNFNLQIPTVSHGLSRAGPVSK